MNIEERRNISTLNPEERTKLTKVINAIVVELTHITELQASLKDLAKTTADDMCLDKAEIMKAAKILLKGNLNELSEAQDRVSQILQVTGNLQSANRE